MACIHRQLETEIPDQIDLFPKQASQIDSPNREWGKVQKKWPKVTEYVDF